MKVVTRGVSCAANKANHLALLHLLTWRHTDGLTVGIKSFQPVAVIDFDVVAVAATPGVDAVSDGHCAGCSRQDLSPVGGSDVGAVVVFNLPGERILPIPEGRRDGEGLRQRPRQHPDGYPVCVWGDDLPASGHKAAQQLCPQVLIVRLHHQIQILLLAAIKPVFLRHIGSRLVGDLNGQHRFGDGLSGGFFLPIVVSGCDLHLVRFRVSRVVHIVHLPQDITQDIHLRIRNSTSEYYDMDADMWRIDFHTVVNNEDGTFAILGERQSVYMDSDGVTQLIVYGE